MGPNSKKRSRKHYVQYRLRVLKELRVAPPSQDIINQMLDESQMSEIAIDSIFLQCIKRCR